MITVQSGHTPTTTPNSPAPVPAPKSRLALSCPRSITTTGKKKTGAKTWIKLAFTFMSAIISLGNSYTALFYPRLFD